MQNQLKRLIMSCFNWVYAVLNFNFFISDILDVNSYMNGIWNYWFYLHRSRYLKAVQFIEAM